MKLAELLTLYYFLDRPELAKGTRQNIHATIRTFERFLARPATLADLNKRTVLAFMGWCADQNYSPKTINNKRGDLITLWYCSADNALLAPPPRIVKRKEPLRFPAVWTIEEMRRLYAATDSIRGQYCEVPKSLSLKITLSLLWETGCRIGSVRKAKIRDVNFEAATWFVPAENIKGKTADRLYRIHPETIALVNSSLIVPREQLVPLPTDRNTLYNWFSQLLHHADLPEDHLHKFHCVRRTAETHAAAERGIAWAAAAVGHTEAVARKHYVNPAFLRNSALFEALPRLS